MHLRGISHERPEDLDIVLVGPTGLASVLMSDVGGNQPVDDVSIIFGGGNPAVPDGADAFTDDAGNPQEAFINALAGQGVVSGTGGGLYNPSGSVSRAQMGSFLARLFLLADAVE